MLSVNEMQARLKVLRHAQQVGRDATAMCRIQVREMPLVTAGEDASEYIPYAIHPDVAGQLGLAVRRLREHMVSYIVEGVILSPHKLPQHDVRSKAMMQALRNNQPQISPLLLHHWCADAQGAGFMRRFMHDNWAKALKSELAPGQGGLTAAGRRLMWLNGINILLIGLIRQEIQRLPEEHADLTDTIMVHVLGATYSWLVQEFATQQLAETDEDDRVAIVETLLVPATPLAFFRRQPKGQIFSDAVHMVTAYGLEAELLSRMRQTSEAMPGEPAASVLAELAAEAMTDHLLKRSWARLCLRDMAERNGQAVWLKWAMDVRRLDTLLSAPEKVAGEMQAALTALGKQPFARWLLAQGNQGLLSRGRQDDKPWRQDDRLLEIFQLFEWDAQLELERRNAGLRWLNRESALVGPGRGPEAGRILAEAHAKGRVVLLQKDVQTPLFVAGGAAAIQGVLCVDWTEYLRVVESRCGAGMTRFLDQTFQPGVMQLVKGEDGIFADGFNASGIVLRGALPKLLLAGVALRQMMSQWFDELEAASDGMDKDEPVISLCLAALGEWSIARPSDAVLGGRLAFSQGLAQAKSAISRNDGLRRLLLSFDARDGKRPPGDVRVESIKMADGKSVPILCNRGFALTGSALQLLQASTAQLQMCAFQSPDGDALPSLAAFRLPGGRPDGFVVRVVDSAGAETETHLVLRIGKVLLGTSIEDVYELMDPQAPGYKPLSQALPRWQAIAANRAL